MVDGKLDSMILINFRFHDPRILSATGRGFEIEEKRAWKGYWNEKLVQTSHSLYFDPEVLTVLLTGRSTKYIDIVNRMLDSRDIKYHLVVLKPKKERGVNDNTLTFKYGFIDDILRQGESIEEVEIYEDRLPHRDAFEDYLKNWRRIKETAAEAEIDDGITMQSLELTEQSETIGLKAFKVHFVEIPPILLDEEVEESLVRTMVEELNESDMADKPDKYVLEKKVFSLGYALEQSDLRRLVDTYLPLSTQKLPGDIQEWRTVRQPSVFIHFSALSNTLAKVGGVGRHVEFEVTHVGISDKVLALSLNPIASYHEVMNGKGDMVLKSDRQMKYWSKNPIPVLVLATKNGGKPVDANYLQDWTVIPKSMENRRFMTRVAIKQEISLERISKIEAKAREEVEAQTGDRSPQRRSFHQLHERTGVPKAGFAGRDVSGKGGRSIYGSEGSRGGNTRNGFGYSLS